MFNEFPDKLHVERSDNCMFDAKKSLNNWHSSVKLDKVEEEGYETIIRTIDWLIMRKITRRLNE